MHTAQLLSAALITFALANLALAAPPATTLLWPAGGQRGQTVAVEVTGAFKPWPVQVSIEGEGVKFTAAKETGKFQVEIAADAAPGVRLVRFYNNEGAAKPLPFVVGTLPELVELEPNDEPAKPQSISLPAVTINGRLAKNGDVDVFAVALRDGQTFVARCDAERPLGAPMDAVLQLVSPTGQVLAQNHDSHGLDPQLVYTAPRDKTVLVRLFAFPSAPDSSIRLSGGERYVYRLTLTTGPVIDHAWPLAIERGKTAAIDLRGWNIPPTARTLQLTAPSEGDTLLAFHAEMASAAPVAVVAYPAIIEQRSGESAQALTPPVVVTGCIARPGEVDAYTFTAKKGERTALRAESQRLGFPLDVVLTVLDAAGKQLATQDDSSGGRDAELLFTAPADGTYRLELRDLYRHASPRHVYRLSLAPPVVEFALSLAASEFVVAVGKSVEIPVMIDRRNGHAEEIALTIAGLPEGTQCAPAASAAKGESAKSVKLKLTAGSQPFVGAITIVGQTAGSTSLRRAAHAPLAGLNTQTDRPWLTITAK